jgi:hypothetical protein
VGTISSGVDRNIYNGQENKCELKGLFNLQPKNNYLRSSSKKAEIFPKKENRTAVQAKKSIR